VLSDLLVCYTGGMAAHSCCRISREFDDHWSLQWPSTTACSCDEETWWIKVVCHFQMCFSYLQI